MVVDKMINKEDGSNKYNNNKNKDDNNNHNNYDHNDYDDLDFYNEEVLTFYLDEDMISPEEIGFMIGYLAS